MPKIILVANYLPDQQASMQRFANMLAGGVTDSALKIEILRPQPLIYTDSGRPMGAAKFAGYLDKFALFLPKLLKAAKSADLVHICDHSNAAYVQFLPNIATLVTCHDMLAFRQVLGENTECRASRSGKYLRLWQLSGLKKATAIVCDSEYTRADVVRTGTAPAAKVATVKLGIDATFTQLNEVEIQNRLAKVNLDLSQPFVLNVGTEHPRKNRAAVLRVFAASQAQLRGKLVLAGQPLSSASTALAVSLGIKQDIIELQNADDDLLCALYNRAFAFLFPSKFEGFGWPPLEAQACGCAVIASNIGPLKENLGESALLRNVEDEAGMSKDLLTLLDNQQRQIWREKSLNNVIQFSTEQMIQQYVNIYLELCAKRQALKD